MAQHRHLTSDVAELLTCYEEMIYQYQQVHRVLISLQSHGYGGQRYPTPLDEELVKLRERAERIKWQCLNKGYCDIESGWHKKRQRRST